MQYRNLIAMGNLKFNLSNTHILNHEDAIQIKSITDKGLSGIVQTDIWSVSIEDRLNYEMNELERFDYMVLDAQLFLSLPIIIYSMEKDPKVIIRETLFWRLGHLISLLTSASNPDALYIQIFNDYLKGTLENLDSYSKSINARISLEEFKKMLPNKSGKYSSILYLSPIHEIDSPTIPTYSAASKNSYVCGLLFHFANKYGFLKGNKSSEAYSGLRKLASEMTGYARIKNTFLAPSKDILRHPPDGFKTHHIEEFVESLEHIIEECKIYLK
jgi:hypothetical protein